LIDACITELLSFGWLSLLDLTAIPFLFPLNYLKKLCAGR